LVAICASCASCSGVKCSSISFRVAEELCRRQAPSWTLVDGHSLALPQVDSIVADGRLEVCDGSYIAFVMKRGRVGLRRSAKDHERWAQNLALRKTKGGAPGDTAGVP
jgi:hypothetical protein